jgi:hypothetical protein
MSWPWLNIQLLKLQKSRFGVRIGAFGVLLCLVALPLIAPLYGLLLIVGADANQITIALMAVLAGCFLLVSRWWGLQVYGQGQLFKHFGLVWTQQNGLEFLAGLGLSGLSLLGVYGLEVGFGWAEAQTSFMSARILLEGGAVALGVGFTEELLFRGWLYHELQRDYSLRVVLWSSSLVYAVLHYLKPLPEVMRTAPQFLGLVLLGVILAWAKRSHHGRLGLPIGLHAGLVWGFYAVQVGQLIQMTQRVPSWITGIDNNPLAGGVGLATLSCLAVGMQGYCRIRNQMVK